MGNAKTTVANVIERLPVIKGCGCAERKSSLVASLRRDDSVVNALKEAFRSQKR